MRVTETEYAALLARRGTGEKRSHGAVSARKVLTLPYAPSANRFYRNYQGRMVMSAEARTYKQTVMLLARAQGYTEPLEGDVRLRVDVYRPFKRGDLDNRLKVTLDSLQGVLYKDDAQIVEIHARRFDAKGAARIVVSVIE